MARRAQIVAWHAGGMWAQAAAFSEVVYTDHVQHLGPRHERTLLAADLVQEGAAHAAVPLLTDTAEAVGQALGPQHPVVLACRANLAEACRRAGDIERAEALDAVTGLRRALGDGHPHTQLAEQGEWIELDVEPYPG